MSRTPSEIRTDLDRQDLSIDPDDLLDSPEEIDPNKADESQDEALERLRRDGSGERGLPARITPRR